MTHDPIAGLPGIVRPECTINKAGSCSGWIVYIDRIMATLSTCVEKWGISSDTQMPDFPYCWNLNGLRMRPPAAFGDETSFAIFSKYGSPLCFSSIGLG